VIRVVLVVLCWQWMALLPRAALAETISITGPSGNLSLDLADAPLAAVTEKLASHLNMTLKGPALESVAVNGKFSGTISEVLRRIMGRRGYAVTYDNNEPVALLLMPPSEAPPAFAQTPQGPTDPAFTDPAFTDPALGDPTLGETPLDEFGNPVDPTALDPSFMQEGRPPDGSRLNIAPRRPQPPPSY
jgi:hypothetical protein